MVSPILLINKNREMCVRRNIFISMVFATLSTVVSCGVYDSIKFCSSVVTNKPREPWCSPKAWDVLMEAEHRVGFPARSKNEFGEIRNFLSRRLAERLSTHDWDDLVNAFEPTAVSKPDKTDDGRLLEECTIIALCEQKKDRPRLVRLLSKHFVDYIGVNPSEFFLAYAGPGSDPILVLAEAYDASHRPDVKEAIVHACHHAFDSLVIHGDGDSDDLFMKHWVEWYITHKNEVEPNYLYREFENTENNRSPLFVPLESKR